MSKTFQEDLREILDKMAGDSFCTRCGQGGGVIAQTSGVEASIQKLVEELIGEPEYRETDDMSLKSWTPEDYKAFGRNRLRSELKAKLRGTKDV